MTSVKIYGAGSIGNHLAYACRNKGWSVLICDPDPKALERTKNDIYPARYGSWDSSIRLSGLDNIPAEKYDLVIIGSPPDSHISLSLEVLAKDRPKILLIEKPLCTPAMEKCDLLVQEAKKAGTRVLVAYNHVAGTNTFEAEKFLSGGTIGKPLSLNVDWLEYWGGIFSAHPWLDGPHDTYLGFSERGGGACSEHSHAINIWQHFSHYLNMGRITEVSCLMDIVDDGTVRYDSYCSINVRSEKGLVGNIRLDVITEPSEKSLRIQGDQGFIEWWVNYEKDCDAVRYGKKGSAPELKKIAKKRPDDFKGEIDNVADLLAGKTTASSLDIERGLDTQLIITAAHRSAVIKKPVYINYKNGYNPGSIIEQ